jgi:hypothetical protein
MEWKGSWKARNMVSLFPNSLMSYIYFNIFVIIFWPEHHYQSIVYQIPTPPIFVNFIIIFWKLSLTSECEQVKESVYASLQSHQQWRSVPLSPHPPQQLLSPEFFILPLLIGVRWNLRVVLICICLMIKVVEHFLGGSQPFGNPQLRNVY